jgi:uncharacterized protein (DUF433 family)
MVTPIAYNVTDAHITRTPGVCGGKPCIAGRRIRVYHVYIWHEVDGLSVDEIARQYNLTVAQVYAALTYAFEHIEDMQAEMQEEEAVVSESMKKNPTKLKPRIMGEGIDDEDTLLPR